MTDSIKKGIDVFTFRPRVPKQIKSEDLIKFETHKLLEELDIDSIEKLNPDLYNDYYISRKCSILGRYIGKKHNVNMKAFCEYLAILIATPHNIDHIFTDLNIKKAAPKKILSQPLQLKTKKIDISNLPSVIKKALEKKAVYHTCIPSEAMNIIPKMFNHGPIRIWTNADTQNTDEQYRKIFSSNINNIKDLMAKVKTCDYLENKIKIRKNHNEFQPIVFVVLQEYDKYKKNIVTKHYKEFSEYFAHLESTQFKSVQQKHFVKFCLLLDCKKENLSEGDIDFMIGMNLIIKNYIRQNYQSFLKSTMNEKLKNTKKNIFGIYASKQKRNLLENVISQDFEDLGINKIIVIDDRENNLQAAKNILNQKGFQVIARHISQDQKHIRQEDFDQIEQNIFPTDKVGFLVDWDGVISRDDIRYIIQNIAIIEILREKGIIY
ncbi:hypothetical protein KJ855_00650 [Patescibacteria group bacterium]|nr:hypothetical protein [Patescibacteria group bacterium]